MVHPRPGNGPVRPLMAGARRNHGPPGPGNGWFRRGMLPWIRRRSFVAAGRRLAWVRATVRSFRVAPGFFRATVPPLRTASPRETEALASLGVTVRWPRGALGLLGMVVRDHEGTVRRDAGTVGCSRARVGAAGPLAGGIVEWYRPSGDGFANRRAVVWASGKPFGFPAGSGFARPDGNWNFSGNGSFFSGNGSFFSGNGPIFRHGCSFSRPSCPAWCPSSRARSAKGRRGHRDGSCSSTLGARDRTDPRPLRTTGRPLRSTGWGSRSATRRPRVNGRPSRTTARPPGTAGSTRPLDGWRAVTGGGRRAGTGQYGGPARRLVAPDEDGRRRRCGQPGRASGGDRQASRPRGPDGARSRATRGRGALTPGPRCPCSPRGRRSLGRRRGSSSGRRPRFARRRASFARPRSAGARRRPSCESLRPAWGRRAQGSTCHEEEDRAPPIVPGSRRGTARDDGVGRARATS
jgi:hypothetical protein